MTNPTEIELPEPTPSRIHKDDPWTPADAGAAPDVDADSPVTANQRIAEFRKKYPTGRIETTVSFWPAETESIRTFSDEAARAYSDPQRVTASTKVYGDAWSKTPLATAHATRGSDDANPVVGERPQETAETASVTRALRYAGILVDR